MLKLFATFATEMTHITIYKRLLIKKIATVMLVFASVAAFATLGDGKGRLNDHSSAKLSINSRNFSLRSGYNYRSNNLLFTPRCNSSLILTSSFLNQKSNTAYILPLKKKILLDKITFKAASTRF